MVYWEETTNQTKENGKMKKCVLFSNSTLRITKIKQKDKCVTVP
jgi:hypothetical protein